MVQIYLLVLNRANIRRNGHAHAIFFFNLNEIYLDSKGIHFRWGFKLMADEI